MSEATQGDYQEALSAVGEGRPSLLIYQGASSTARASRHDELVEALGSTGLEVRRAAVLAWAADRPGALASELRLDEIPETGVAFVLDEAHHADPTTLGRLHTALTGAEGPVLLSIGIAHTEGVVALTLARLRSAVERVGAVWEVDLEDEPIEGAVAMADLEDLDRRDRRAVEALALAGSPIGTQELGGYLAVPEDLALEVGERLVDGGWAEESEHGFVATAQTAAIARLLGSARRSVVHRQLADSLARVEPIDHAALGRHYLAGGRWSEALEHLAKAGLALAGAQSVAEALPIVDGALAAADRADEVDPELRGRLLLARAQGYRLAGWTDRAAHDLAEAIPVLRGSEQVAALGWAAQVADDGQDLLAAERLLATGELAALRAGQPLMAGSLLTFHGRILNRLGFADESEAAMAKGNAMLADDPDLARRYRARSNAAGVSFDQGRMADAEFAFSQLVDEAGRVGGPAMEADALGWWARSLMAVGRVSDALGASERAVAAGDSAAVAGPVYLAHLAAAEGAGSYGDHAAALEAADDALGIIRSQFPAWENVGLFYRAKALAGLDRLPEARSAVTEALAVSPGGANGRRWFLRIRALYLGLAESWASDEAEAISEEMVESRWLLSAVEMLTVRAERDRDPKAGERAAALALDLGVPMAAARAVQAAGSWETPVGTATARGLRRLESQLPESWIEPWKADPTVAAALATEEVGDEVAVAAQERAKQELEDAMRAAGLREAAPTSPAQRRAAGLRFSPRRRIRRAALVAISAAAVVVLGLGGGLLAANLGDEPAAAPVATAPTAPPTTLALEDRRVEAPSDIAGQWGYRGDPEIGGALGGRTGASDRSGLTDPVGAFWSEPTNDAVEASPVLFGRQVVVGSKNGTLYSFDLRVGARGDFGSFVADGEIVGAAAVATLSLGEGASQPMVFFGTKNGSLYAVRLSGLTVLDRRPLGGSISAAPLVVGGLVYVGTGAGEFFAVDPIARTVVWQYPAEGSVGPITAAAATDGKSIFVVDTDGNLAALDPLTGEVGCEATVSGGTVVNPVVVDGTVYVGGVDGNVWAFDAANCGSRAPFFVGNRIDTAPAVVNGVLYVPDRNIMIAFDVATGDVLRTTEPVDGAIRSAPVVAAGILYFGSDDGNVYAYDAETLVLVWKWSTGGHVRADVAIGDGVVVVGSGDGFVTAIAGG